MARDALLSLLHHFAVYALVGCLVAEMVLLRALGDARAVGRLASVDLWFGITAALVLIAGFLRVFFGLKSAAFYLHNPVFWLKIGLFVVIGLISIAPTLAIIRWNRGVRATPARLPAPAEVRRTARLVHLEAGLLVLIPVCAVLMARGVGD